MAVGLDQSRGRKPNVKVKHNDLPPREVAMPFQVPSLEKLNHPSQDPIFVQPDVSKSNKDSQTNSQTSPETNSRTSNQTDSQTNSRTSNQTDGQTNSRTSNQTDSQTNSRTSNQTDSQTNSRTSNQTDGQTNSQTSPETNSRTSSQTNNKTSSRTSGRTNSETSNQTKSAVVSIKDQSNQEVEEFDPARYLRHWSSSPKLKVLALLCTCCELVGESYLTDELRLRPLAKKLKLTDANFRKILGRLTLDGAVVFEKDLSKYGPNGWSRYSIRKDLWLLLTNASDQSD